MRTDDVSRRLGPDRDHRSPVGRDLREEVVCPLDEIEPASVGRPGGTEAAGDELSQVTSVGIHQPDPESRTRIAT